MYIMTGRRYCRTILTVAASGVVIAALWWLHLWFPPPAESGEHIIVDTFRNRLHHYCDGEVTSYDVGTGREAGLTPTGRFTIVVREVLKPGESNPQLGTRWLGLSVPGDEDGLRFGIHGTDEPSSIGGYVSGGCIRMREEDVRRLFARVEEGTPVIILPRPLPVRWLGGGRGG
jgi:hypothetical protein